VLEVQRGFLKQQVPKEEAIMKKNQLTKVFFSVVATLTIAQVALAAPGKERVREERREGRETIDAARGSVASPGNVTLEGRIDRAAQGIVQKASTDSSQAGKAVTNIATTERQAARSGQLSAAEANAVTIAIGEINGSMKAGKSSSEAIHELAEKRGLDETEVLEACGK
jgi:hypothetical protein